MEEVAYIVENDVLIHAILKEIEKCNQIEIKNNSKIEKVRLQRDGFANGLVYLKSGEVYSSELVVSVLVAILLPKLRLNLYITHVKMVIVNRSDLIEV